MKKNLILKSFFLIVLTFLMAFNQMFAQMPFRSASRVSVIGWSDDTHYLIRNYDEKKNLVIFSTDIKSGKSVPAPATKSERDLLVESLPSGVSIRMNDVLSPDMMSVIINKDNDLFFFKKGEKELRRLTNDKTPEVNARFSPDGLKIAYTKNKDLYIYDLSSNREIRLTTDASANIYNGYSSWVYMEEILERPSQYAAFWWAPDGSKIAYLRTDETEVPFFTLNRLDEADGVHGLLEVVHYPQPGDPNPRVKMGIADVSTGKTTWVKTDYSVDQYMAWPFWTPESRKLAIQVLNRDQNDLQIILADPSTGEYSKIYEETIKSWLEIQEDIYVMNNNSGFILHDLKNGWENLVYQGWDGKPIARLTNFNFRVSSIEKVDEAGKIIYFTATGTESTDNHLFRVGLDGKNLIQITKGDGSHNVSISPKGNYFIDTWSSIASAGSIIAFDKSGKQIREIYKFDQPAYDPAKNSRAEFVKIRTADSLFDMPAIITYPVNFDASKKYPVIFTIYGGPNYKNVYNSWQGTNPSWYAQNGIITFTLDHRGSGQFGKRGLDYIYRCLGKWEILDYEDGVKWLLAKPFIDGSRIGITGSSYGGYMTCLALTKGADFWTHGIAISSVTDWKLYDDIYTERYMDTPQDNPDGYKEGSALTFAATSRANFI